MRSFFKAYILVIALCASLFSCGDKNGVLYYGALGLGEVRIYVSTIAASNLMISSYDIHGNFLEIVSDFTQTVDSPRGLTKFDRFHLAVALDGTDRIESVSILDGTRSPFILSSLLTGNLYDIERDLAGNYYVIETNAIERFSPDGVRLPITGTAYFTPPVGACSPTTLRGLTLTQNGHLAAVATGNDVLNIINVSGGTPTCVASTAIGNDPIDVVQHPNGYLYIVTQNPVDAIVRTTDTGAGLTTLTTFATTYQPTAIAVHPDGSLLVANDGTDSINIYSVSGDLLGTFAKNSFTNTINDIQVFEGL